MHPRTGELLLKESVLQDVDVLRALLAAITALDSIRRRTARRAQLPQNVGQRWTESETETLRGKFVGGEALEEIARALGRSIVAVTHRLAKLGLVTDDGPSLNWRRRGRPHGDWVTERRTEGDCNALRVGFGGGEPHLQTNVSLRGEDGWSERQME